MRILESTILPFTNGTLEVDTTKQSLTIFMKPGTDEDILKIVKISNDKNMISLYSEEAILNECNIISFGLPSTAKVSKGKIRSITLKWINNGWKIVGEK